MCVPKQSATLRCHRRAERCRKKTQRVATEGRDCAPGPLARPRGRGRLSPSQSRTWMTTPKGTLEVGDRLDDRYEILAVIGEGGFGRVYKAEQVSTGQLVAIKLLHPDKVDGGVQMARFEREMMLIGKLKH